MIWRRLLCSLLPALLALTAFAQDPAAAASNSQAAADAKTAAAAAVATGNVEPRTPDFLEHIVDSVLEIFDVRSSSNTLTHYVIAACFLVVALLLRRVVTSIIFASLKKIASRTKSTLDDKMLPALEAPVSTFIMVAGIIGALKVLKLSPESDRAVDYGSTVAFSLVVFWGLARAFGALLDHMQEIASQKKMGVAAFMPWIKKSLITLFFIFGTLMVVQSLGYDVKAILAGLGIGGLAFALAAQDTLANVFGSIVVAIDQPFKIGEAVKIGAHEGAVEDIGLRSTKLRAPGRNLIIIPNKTVAAESVVNNSRFAGRRVDQVFALTYDTTAEQMEEMVQEIRRIVKAEKEVDTNSVLVFFRDLNASSLDIWSAYNVTDPDFGKSMELRQRINLAVMRAVEKRGLSFAFPTTTMHLATTPAPDDKRGGNPVDKALGKGDKS